MSLCRILNLAVSSWKAMKFRYVMLTMSGPVTTVSILFSIFPARVLTSSSSRSLASWTSHTKKLIRFIIVKQLRLWPLRDWDTALEWKWPKSDKRCRSLVWTLYSVINKRSVVWSREGRSRWDSSRLPGLLLRPEDSIFQIINATSKTRHVKCAQTDCKIFFNNSSWV